MKREYMKPAMRVCELQQKCNILTGSDTINTLSTNFTEEDLLEYGGGGAYDAR